MKKKGKVVDLEAEEGTEYIDTKGVEPISKFLENIPLRKGKLKVLKDLDARQLLLNTPLLPENLTFAGSRLAQIRHLKLEDWDLEDHEKFPHHYTNTYMKWVFYKESGVTAFELME